MIVIHALISKATVIWTHSEWRCWSSCCVVYNYSIHILKQECRFSLFWWYYFIFRMEMLVFLLLLPSLRSQTPPIGDDNDMWALVGGISTILNPSTQIIWQSMINIGMITVMIIVRLLQWWESVINVIMQACSTSMVSVNLLVYWNHQMI